MEASSWRDLLRGISFLHKERTPHYDSIGKVPPKIASFYRSHMKYAIFILFSVCSDMGLLSELGRSFGMKATHGVCS